MIKDLISAMNNVYSDSNLNLHEKSLLMYLIKQYNHNYGYAYPKYEDIMSATGIGRRANVSSAIKALVNKGYITVKKVVGNKAHYFIEKYLYFVDNKSNSTKKANSTKVETNEECTAKKVEIANFEVVEDKEKVEQDIQPKQHKNNSRIAKETTVKLTPFYCEAFSHINENILDMALKEKAKKASLLLKKCIRLTKQVGLEFSKEFTNKVLQYSDYKEEWEVTTEYNEMYVMYVDKYCI